MRQFESINYHVTQFINFRVSKLIQNKEQVHTMYMSHCGIKTVNIIYNSSKSRSCKQIDCCLS